MESKFRSGSELEINLDKQLDCKLTVPGILIIQTIEIIKPVSVIEKWSQD